MTDKHLSEDAIQQYVLDKPGCEPGITGHVEACEHCRTSVATYESLFSGVRQQSKPEFDFDLSGLVLAQLPRRKPRFAPGIVLAPLLALTICGAAGVPLYLFRKDLSWLFAGVLPMAMYLILITAVTFLAFQLMEMVRKYRKQMKALNY
jgi:hypothetical protein